MGDAGQKADRFVAGFMGSRQLNSRVAAQETPGIARVEKVKRHEISLCRRGAAQAYQRAIPPLPTPEAGTAGRPALDSEG